MKKAISLVFILALGLASLSLAAEDTWTTKANMPTARYVLSSGMVDGKIYAIGGDTGLGNPGVVEEYDPAIDNWTKKTNMPIGIGGGASGRVNGKIYVIGGLSSQWSPPVSSIQVYDPMTDMWSMKADMPTARGWLSVSVANGKIYAIGGAVSFDGTVLSNVEQYDPATDTWTRKADMPTARACLSTSVVNGKIYAIGGTLSKPWSQAISIVEEYDPETDTWTKKNDMLTQRSYLSTSVVNEKIYAVGGFRANYVALSSMEQYDPATDTWVMEVDMPTSRWGLSTSAVNGKIYAIGGRTIQGSPLSIVEEYDTGFGVPPPDYNIGPVADAGLPRYAAQDPVVLDGTGSYDPDDSGTLSYTWRQSSGPLVEIGEADTTSPAISGFIQTDEIQECEFELVVSDGELTSLPDIVKVIIVPNFGSNSFLLENPPFDADKPTIIYFGGGDCRNGLAGDGVPLFTTDAWLSRANIIDFRNGYTPDSGGGARTYYKYGDMIIVYLSSVAPDYKQPIQTIGWSTGGDPAIDVGIHLNRVYRDARYSVNHVTQIDGGCRIMSGWGLYSQIVESFLNSSVDGEQCWIDHYYGTVGYAYEPFPHGDILWVRSGLGHSQIRDWYRNSLTRNDMNKFNSGVVAGAYLSVIGPGKNLQLAPTDTYYFSWDGSVTSGQMTLQDEAQFPGRLPEPVTLVGPEDGAFVDANGVVLSCEISENAIGYQLLFGSEPYRVMDYMIISDTPVPPSEVITSFPYEQTWWTIKVYDAFGSTIYADPICVYPEKIETLEPGLVANWRLDETQGDTAYDSVIGAFGSVYGGAIWQPNGGHEGGALEFDGIDDFISIPRVIETRPDSFSVFAWVKNGAPGQVILSQVNISDWLSADTTDGSLMSDMTFYMKTSRPLQSQTVIADGNWHRVGLVWDGSSRILYIDDIEVASDTYVTGFLYGDLQIGAGNKLEAGTFWSGLIDDVRIYNRAVKP